jgi:WSC domain
MISLECFCGNTLAAGSVAATDGRCNMVCAGNATEYCGGPNGISLYQYVPPGSEVLFNNATSSNSSSTSISPTISITSSSVAPTATTLSTLTASASSTTITNSTASTSTASSAAATSSSPWTYYGCANETAGRALSSAATAAPDMTIEKCQSFCLSQSLPVAGVEYSTECFCGTGLNPGSTVNQTGCSMPCGGNSAQTCGGPSRLSVYKYNGTLVTPSNPETIGTYKFQGCYSEPTTGGRALPSYSFVNATAMSAEFCVGGCSAKGYSYAGAEYAKECWCANALNTASTALATTSCDMLCAGNKYEYCGAGSKLSIWKSR